MPYDQCLPHEIARKEDFGYAIDPRNNDKGIEAEIDSSEVVHITDANGTNVATERIPSANNEEKTETRRRREAPAEHKAEDSKKAPVSQPFNLPQLNKALNNEILILTMLSSVFQ